MSENKVTLPRNVQAYLPRNVQEQRCPTNIYMSENKGTLPRNIEVNYASKHILCELAQTDPLHVNIKKINCMLGGCVFLGMFLDISW